MTDVVYKEMLNLRTPPSVDGVRCEACELEAARMAYKSGLGASEWAAFIHRVSPCAGCGEVQRLMGTLRPPETPAPRPTRVSVSLAGERSES